MRERNTISDDKVAELRMFVDSDRSPSLTEAANKYGIAVSTCSSLVSGISRSHVYPPKSQREFTRGRPRLSERKPHKIYRKPNPLIRSKTASSIAIEVLAQHGFPPSTMFELFFDGNFTTAVLRHGSKLFVGTTKRNCKMDSYSIEMGVRHAVGRAAKKCKDS
jgi:hypothetical protein